MAQPLFYQFRYICQACQRCMLQIPMFFCIQETQLMERGISAVLSEPRLAPSEEQKADGMGGFNCAHFVNHASRVSFFYIAMPLHSGTSWRRCTISNQGSEHILSSPPYALLQISNLLRSCSASPDQYVLCSSLSMEYMMEYSTIIAA